MAASCGAGIVSALIPYSLGFAESLCFSDQETIKIKLILGGEDGKLFEELLFFGFSVEHALLSQSYTHISPSQCRGKFPTHQMGSPGGVGVSSLLRLCAGAELSLCLPQKCLMVMSFPFNNLPFMFHHLFMFRNGNLGGKKDKFKPIAQNLCSACVGALFITATVQCLDDVSGERCWMLLLPWPRENIFLLPSPVFVGRARSVIET